MEYSILVKAYQELESTTKRLEKTKIISELLKKTNKENIKEVIYLLQGRVFPPWDERKLGMSSRLMLKIISLSTGTNVNKVEKDWSKKGDLGKVAEELIKNKKQKTLFSSKLSVQKVFTNLVKLPELQGSGTVSKKIQLVSELLTSATPEEARFITRTVLEELRIGVAQGTIRDSIVWAYLPTVLGINTEEKHGKSLKVNSLDDLKNLNEYDTIIPKDEILGRQIYNSFINKVQHLYNLTNDFAQVAESIRENKPISKLKVGIPINPMLAIKAADLDEAFKHLGKPILCEFKIDGFRAQWHKDGKDIKLFTRRLENVTNQFKEIIPLVEKHVNAKNFIIDTEIVGYDPKTNKYLPFQNISQRIKRKYNLEKKSKELPIEINVFDILYKDGEVLMDLPQKERRRILEETIKPLKRKIVTVKKLISSDKKEIEKFYKESLRKGNEGLMLKNLKKPYTPGRRVAGWMKMKPVNESLDLIITSAIWGDGKRAKWLSSFTVSCREKNKFLEIGKVGTGIAEKEGELSFPNLTRELKKYIINQKGKKVFIKPNIVLEIEYDEIQKSPNYDSGFALRFPRVTKIRHDLGPNSINNLEKIKSIYKKQNK